MFRSKLVSHTKLELAALAAEVVFLDWITVIKPNRPDWQVQTHADTNVLIEPAGKFARGGTWRHDLLRVETPRGGIDKSTIIENSEAYPFNDWDRVLYRVPEQAIPADRIPLEILGPNITESEPAERIRTAAIEAIEDRDYRVAVGRTPVLYGRNFTVQQEDRVVRKMEILGHVKVEPINLDGASKESVGNVRREINPRSFAGKKRAVARIIGKADRRPALGVVLTSLLDEAQKFR